MALAQAGARPLSADCWISSQAGLHPQCNSNNSSHSRCSVSFACRRSSIAGATVSVRHPSGHSARVVGVAAAGAPSSGSRVVVRAVVAEKAVETVDPASAEAPQVSRWNP